jgi:dTDP-4-dehydrorhamnose reductase
MSTRYLILGSYGMLGRAWRELLARRALPFDHADRDVIDITDPASLARAISPSRRYSHVVNCAAWTDVDGAEQNEHGAGVLNADAVAHLAHACAAIDATLVHYSTDYVFNGTGASPYRVDGPREPLSAYGRTKARGEEALERSRARWLCVRTSWLYAPWGKNFLRTIANAALARPELKVVNDQRGRPTSAEHLARATLALLDRGATGMHHATDGVSAEDGCTWFDFARRITQRLRETSPKGTPVADVRPCTTAEFPRPAKRPAYSVLDLSATESKIGPMPDWRTHVDDAVDRREA